MYNKEKGNSNLLAKASGQVLYIIVAVAVAIVIVVALVIGKRNKL